MAHGDVVKMVSRSVASDPAALDGIERGILNLRVFARELIRAHKWSFTEEAVVSALRRFKSDRHYGKTLERARDILAKSQVNIHSGMCSVALSNSKEVYLALPKLFTKLDSSKGERLRVSSSDNGFKIILNETSLGRLHEIFGKDAIDETKTGLDEISVITPAEGKNTPGILAVITNALAAARVNLAEVIDGISQHILLVEGGDSLRAYEVLKDLVRRRS